MAHKVLKNFKDKTNNEKLYTTKDTYASDDSKRIAFLAKEGFIEEVAEKVPDSEISEPQHVGGGYYELPNGEKVKGKEQALAAMKDVETRGE